MPWLVRDARVLATIEVATSLRDRTRGLLGREGIDGAILLRPAKSVHTLRMQFPIDVAFCDHDLVVLKVVTLARNRVSLPVLKAHAVIEAEAGMMAKWGIVVGDRLLVRGLEGDATKPDDGAEPVDLDAPAPRPVTRVRRADPGPMQGPAAGTPPGHGVRLVTP